MRPLAAALLLGHAVPTPLLPREPVNARDFGALGNCSRGTTPSTLTEVACDVDDAPALQRAVDAAQLQGRSLFIPAGVYGVASPVVVRCTGARDLVYDNGVGGGGGLTLCSGFDPSSGRVYHPLRISGEGMESTVLIATAAMQVIPPVPSSFTPLGPYLEGQDPGRPCSSWASAACRWSWAAAPAPAYRTSRPCCT